MVALCASPGVLARALSDTGIDRLRRLLPSSALQCLEGHVTFGSVSEFRLIGWFVYHKDHYQREVTHEYIVLLNLPHTHSLWICSPVWNR